MKIKSPCIEKCQLDGEENFVWDALDILMKFLVGKTFPKKKKLILDNIEMRKL